MKSPSDRVIRKALLQAHAEIERYELGRCLADVQAAASPKALVQTVLPGLVGGAGMPGTAWTRAGAQLAGLYRQYPLVSSALAGLLGKSGTSRLAQVVGVGLALAKALAMLRRRSR